MSEPLDWIADATRAGTELREAIKLGHELLRDLKQTHKMIKDDIKNLKTEVNETALRTFREAFDMVLDGYTKSLEAKASECMDTLTTAMITESESVMVKLLTYAKGDSLL